MDIIDPDLNRNDEGKFITKIINTINPKIFVTFEDDIARIYHINFIIRHKGKVLHFFRLVYNKYVFENERFYIQ